ncbi:MAG: class I SAM-dependent methyltransferase [Caulobacterales bacterium]|jgi:predicted O-methyltransferase YrrM
MSEHLHSDGQADWDISQEVLNTLRSSLKPGSVTLETGAGRSTVTFAELGCIHHCVTPSHDEAARIKAHCQAAGISTENLHFHFGFSQDVLPRLEIPPLDLALIDGGHGFPIPAIDWQYIAPRLRVGGLMLIDDVDLWTGAMIVDFLKGESTWKHEATLRGRTAAFRLVSVLEVHEWTKQPTVVAKSRFTQLRRKAINALGLIASGKIGEIGKKLENERRLAQSAKRDY